jgi:hypothetical protein
MRPLLVVAVVLFLIAALGAFSTSVHVNVTGFLCLGLAAFAGDQLLGARSLGLTRSVTRRRLRSHF